MVVPTRNFECLHLIAVSLHQLNTYSPPIQHPRNGLKCVLLDASIDLSCLPPACKVQPRMEHVRTSAFRRTALPLRGRPLPPLPLLPLLTRHPSAPSRLSSNLAADVTRIAHLRRPMPQRRTHSIPCQLTSCTSRRSRSTPRQSDPCSGPHLCWISSY